MTENVFDGLKKYFGYDTFKNDIQESAVKAIVKGMHPILTCNNSSRLEITTPYDNYKRLEIILATLKPF